MIRMILFQPLTLGKPVSGLLLAVSLSLVSCKDDPELVKQRNQQEAEIRQLEGELTLLYQQLDNAPEDRTGDLEHLRKKVSSDRERVDELEKVVADLESQKRQLEREFTEYKNKYKIR